MRIMQNDGLNFILSSLQSKIEKLILLHRKALEDNQILNAQITLMEEKLRDQGQIIEDLIQSVKPARRGTAAEEPVVEMSAESLERMLRDINRCIELLDNEQTV